MERETISDLVAFVAVAREGSFTRAAVRLGLSQSALSHIIKGLEARLGLRLLSRTTRSVAPTAAGARLMETLGPGLDQMDAALLALGELRDRPSGVVRLTAGDHAVEQVLMPRIGPFLARCPDVRLDIRVDNGLTNIVTEGLDAGIRLGEQVDRDMVAVRVGPDIRFVVVGTPGYFAGCFVPKVPQDLADHSCIQLFLTTLDAPYVWEFAKGKRAVKVRASGPLMFNRVPQIVQAAEQGLGLAFVPYDRVAAAVAQGRLIAALQDWCPPQPGYHLYYPSRKQPSAAFSALVEALRWQGP